MYVELDTKEVSEDEQDSASNDDEELESADNEESDDGDNEMDDAEQGDSDDGNAGWANTFAKVLQQKKPKDKKYLVLSKATKLADRKEKSDTKKETSFEIAGKEDKSSDEEEDVKPDIEDAKPSKDLLELALIERKEKDHKLLELRVKPHSMDRERERSYKRIATKGVVQLFNAVRSQQRDLVDRLEKAGPLDHKRDEVLNNINKRQFLDMLMGGKRAKSENIDNPVKNEEDIKPEDNENSSRPSQWSVLRDDFMTNKKIASHWDKDDESENDDQPSNDIDGMDSDD